MYPNSDPAPHEGSHGTLLLADNIQAPLLYFIFCDQVQVILFKTKATKFMSKLFYILSIKLGAGEIHGASDLKCVIFFPRAGPRHRRQSGKYGPRGCLNPSCLRETAFSIIYLICLMPSCLKRSFRFWSAISGAASVLQNQAAFSATCPHDADKK